MKKYKYEYTKSKKEWYKKIGERLCKNIKSYIGENWGIEKIHSQAIDEIYGNIQSKIESKFIRIKKLRKKFEWDNNNIFGF